MSSVKFLDEPFSRKLQGAIPEISRHQNLSSLKDIGNYHEWEHVLGDAVNYIDEVGNEDGLTYSRGCHSPNFRWRLAR